MRLYYHPISTCSRRVLLLARHLGIELELVVVDLGKGDAGHISAAKFLERFIEGTPWLHLDIAGPAFLTAPDSYRGKGGTGMGVRLLYEFLTKRLA